MYNREKLIGVRDELVKLWEEGKIKVPVHFPGGNEDQLINIFKEVRRADYVFCSHRNLYHYLLHGGDFKALQDGLVGEQHGLCQGRAGSMGTIDPRINFYSSAIVGGLVNVAVGAGWALAGQHKNDPLGSDENATRRHVWCFVGDGVLDGGHFWEALQYTIGYDLPVTFVIENNNRSTCTTIKQRLGNPWIHSMLPSVRKRLIYYTYDSSFPHVGTGKYIQF